MYQFIQQQTSRFPVNLLCQVVGVSRSAYYAYATGQSFQLTKGKENLTALVKQTFYQHRRRYGSRRLVKALQAEGIRTSRHAVAKVLSVNNLKAIQPRSFVPRTTDSRHTLGFSPNLLIDQPIPTQPNRIWVGDITYVALANGQWAYLAAWMDLFSRLIVGWHLDVSMDEALVVTAFRRAVLRRSPQPGLIVHSDRGGQYASKALRRLLSGIGCLQSMSRPDDPYDNAFAESYWSRLKAELLEEGAFMSLEDARLELGEYIENYYNPVRLHSSLAYVSPAVFERRYYQTKR